MRLAPLVLCASAVAPLALCASAVAPRALADQAVEPLALDGRTITAIVIDGEQTLPEHVIRRDLTIAKGDRVAQRVLGSQTAAIMKTGLFDRVEVSGEVDGASGVILTITVTERPFVNSVRILGARVFPRESAGIVGVTAGDRFNPVTLRRGVSALESTYRFSGYAHVRIETETRPAGDLKVDVAVRVTEGPRVTVKKVLFKGNQRVPAEDLAAALRSTVGAAYLPDDVEVDLLLLAAHYYDHGFVMVKIAPRPSITFTKDRREATIAFTISEGDVFSLGKLAVIGDLEETEQELLARLGVASGETFSRKKLADGIDAVRAFYERRGFAAATVVPITNVDAGRRLVDVTLEIHK
jgi:outer membrane protein insertion porin family